MEDWDELPGTLDVGRFYGGDLHGVWDKLDYLKGLGVECIYLNPVFVSPPTTSMTARIMNTLIPTME